MGIISFSPDGSVTEESTTSPVTVSVLSSDAGLETLLTTKSGDILVTAAGNVLAVEG